MLIANRITGVGAVWSLVNLEQLKLQGAIETIGGIEALTNLKSLDLEGTNFRTGWDVHALRTLTTLTTLDISNNRITDATCLTSLVNLQILDVSNKSYAANNKYCDVWGLDALPKIKRIRTV